MNRPLHLDRRPKHWMHHLEVPRVEDLDDEVAGWLRETYDRV